MGSTGHGVLLSVIIPIYNVEDFLDECLSSVADQDLKKIEVIMVDDGSTDGSAAIARAWEARDPRFKLYSQKNRGLGAARNTGVAEATGRYLTFLDSDDATPRAAYKKMVETLEQSGSDFATGNVHRFDGERVWQAPMYVGVCSETRLRTHVSRDRELLRDLLAHNKVWRREFWEREQLSFREGVLYEDLPTTIPAHVKARSVDVLSDVVDLWRERKPGAPSITQAKTSDVRQVRDRLAGVRYVSHFLTTWPDPSLKRDYDRGALERDVRYFVDILPWVDSEYRAEALGLFRDFVESVGPGVVDELTSANRIKYFLIMNDQVEVLLDFLRARRANELAHETLTLRRRRAYLDVPQLKAAALPDDVIDVTDEVRLVTRVDKLHLDENELRIRGWAFIDRVPVTARRQQTITVWLDSGTRSVRAKVKRIPSPRATLEAGQDKNCYDWAGFEAVVPLRKLKGRTGFARGRWEVKIGAKRSGVYADARLRRPVRGATSFAQTVSLTNDLEARAYWRNRSALELEVRSRLPELTLLSESAGSLDLGLEGPDVGDAELVLENRVHEEVIRVPVASGGTTTRVRVDPAQLFAGGTGTTDEEDAPTETVWKVGLQSPGVQSRKVRTARGVTVVELTGGGQVAARQSRHGHLEIVARRVGATLVKASMDETATFRLVVRGQQLDDLEGLVVAADGRAEDWLIEGKPEGSEVRFDVPMGGRWRFGSHIPFKAGTWRFLLRYRQGEVPLEFDRDFCTDLPISTVYRDREYRLDAGETYGPVVTIGSELMDDEVGRYNQHRLRRNHYLRARDRLEPTVLYQCFQGKEFADSPRAIMKEFIRRGTPFRHLVTVRDQQACVPPGAAAVPIWSKEYYEALARAQVIIDNTHLPPYFERTPGQLVVQTWHGLGLKRVGLDLPQVHFANPRYVENLLREVDHWDMLISPNPFTSPILRSAFGYDGPLLEAGAPRNDIFHAPDRDRVAADTRELLGVPAGSKVVLYAPTWRDHVSYGRGRYGLDLQVDFETMADKLGQGYSILFRKHANILDRLPSRFAPFVKDVSDFPDVQRLLLISDVLISDYSTLMFDYANTGRPMIFYTYDLEHYRDVLRGFYFDFENEAPGPLVHTEGQLFDAVLRADEFADAYSEAYRKFQDRFCRWDDGRASERVVDAILEELARRESLGS
jgi:CDP-glycerol glycerophosphotransferase